MKQIKSLQDVMLVENGNQQQQNILEKRLVQIGIEILDHYVKNVLTNS
jgi:hypothetical protein